MAIKIIKVGDLYKAEASPPSCPKPWKSKHGMVKAELIHALLHHGCKEQEIDTAFSNHGNDFW